MNTSMGLLGCKIGMTQLFDEAGNVVPVTVIQAGPNTVLQVKTADGADGYDAIQLGYAEKKALLTNKPDAGHFAKAGATPKKHVGEIRLPADDVKKFAPGQQLKVTDVFKIGDICDVTGTSKGRGFAGVFKRHHFAGFENSHGTHEYFRHGGSIGTRLTPGHVMKGKKMPGHMGAEQVTVQNMAVVRLDEERGLVFIRGGVPGPNGGFVLVRKAVKKG